MQRNTLVYASSAPTQNTMITSEQLAAYRHEYRINAWYRSILLLFGAFAVCAGFALSYLAFRASRISRPGRLNAAWYTEVSCFEPPVDSAQ